MKTKTKITELPTLNTEYELCLELSIGMNPETESTLQILEGIVYKYHNKSTSKETAELIARLSEIIDETMNLISREAEGLL